MICQFSEHEHGIRSHDDRVKALDAVAKALGVLIHIDGLPYGSNVMALAARRSPREKSATVRCDRLSNGGGPIEGGSVIGPHVTISGGRFVGGSAA